MNEEKFERFEKVKTKQKKKKTMQFFFQLSPNHVFKAGELQKTNK